MAAEKKVAFITGGNRGIGLETARQLGKQNVKVVIGSRDVEKGKAALTSLGLPITRKPTNISIRTLANWISSSTTLA
jgi:NAD(P)-dependent dehydrogenase (short-subunit alcohol dehydrogenase family)